MISTTVESPVGPLTLVSNGRALTRLEFQPARGVASGSWSHGTDRVLDRARRELEAYFSGRLRVFEVPLAPEGTPFQCKVWDALLTIPYGATRSYGEQARAIGQPAAARAVGLANGRNPIAIIIPCHRVIGANGSLTGYGGGMARKKLLLDLEQGKRALIPI
jgi:methylated-DNA-[protein]-cysteine S-methyltransferase